MWRDGKAVRFSVQANTARGSDAHEARIVQLTLRAGVSGMKPSGRKAASAR